MISNYQAFSGVAIEAPYVMNLRAGVPENSNRAIGWAARPSDRMSDVFKLVAGDIDGDATDGYTPWVMSDFRLPELETTLNIRTSSLFDGLVVTSALVGMLAQIDDEIVEVLDITVSQIKLRRGCCDTIPQVHVAGSRLWFFEPRHARDPVEHGGTVVYKLRPVVYGPAVDADTLPSMPVTFNRRAERPYAPGRMMVNMRPWFEEAQAVSGEPTVFAWARRNRVTQGAASGGHTLPDTKPEEWQVTRLTFFFETPSVTPGAAADRNVLREIEVQGTAYSYPYEYAQADGNTAGTTTGVCGTVVIYCRVCAVRDDLESTSGYIAPIRVPSYPC